MLPCRGLRPVQLAQLAPRQPRRVCCNAPRKFSTAPRIALFAPSCRTRPPHSTRWRAGAAMRPNIGLTASSIRHGSWYAPWSWGTSSTPSTPINRAPASDLSDHAQHVPAVNEQHIEPVVTSNTPELAPAGIDRAAVVNDLSVTPKETFEELLSRDMSTPMPKAELDPTQLIDHAGQLKQLGLEYGWGMTTLFENGIEAIYLTSGWGWAGSIVAACVGVRCFMFTLQLLSSDKMAAMAALAPAIKPLQDKMAIAKASGDTQQVNLLQMQQNEIIKPYQGGMMSMGGFMIMQMWVGFCAFRFLRAMGTLPVPGMSEDGWAWFTDLTVRDPYFILPMATTALMYKLFKSGGEMGVQPNTGVDAVQRGRMMTGLAIFIGIATSFQPAGLQLYFLTTSILGAGTSYLLRQNSFRRFFHIREIPSKESNALYAKVVKGEMTLEQLKVQNVKAGEGKFAYQAAKPTAAHVRRSSTLPGINVKAGTALPAHLRAPAPVINKERPDRDVDFEQGPRGSLTEKMDYYRRNYRLSYLWRRTTGRMENMVKDAGYGGGPALTKDQARRKKAAEDYEVERRRRFEKRR